MYLIIRFIGVRRGFILRYILEKEISGQESFKNTWHVYHVNTVLEISHRI